ncbi:hypothetical protein ACFY2I_41735 [Streptomyces mirabilis]|uniref:hypothetical protein n=1 Tax=Streptomyces mirabilis TaxID=68239 RepID=UPI0036990553
MKTELDSLAIALYVKTDDLLKGSPQCGPWRPAVGIAPRLSDVEPVTLAMMQATKATSEDASFALTQISGRDGFATLRSVAEKIEKAAVTYQELGCATNPAEAATRHACLEPAAVLAQGFPDLRDGANLGLAGK